MSVRFELRAECKLFELKLIKILLAEWTQLMNWMGGRTKIRTFSLYRPVVSANACCTWRWENIGLLHRAFLPPLKTSSCSASAASRSSALRARAWKVIDIISNSLTFGCHDGKQRHRKWLKQWRNRKQQQQRENGTSRVSVVTMFRASSPKHQVGFKCFMTNHETFTFIHQRQQGDTDRRLITLQYTVLHYILHYLTALELESKATHVYFSDLCSELL